MSYLTDWMEESKAFDQVADVYDRYRPNYPVELIDKIKDLSKIDANGHILEIGAGSGKATDQFIDVNAPMLCIEQGYHLVEKAKEKYQDNSKIQFVHQDFNDWEGDEHVFDLAFSAQAFHWILKPKGYKDLERYLKKTGLMAIFWNKYMLDDRKSTKALCELTSRYKVLNLLDEEHLERFIDRTCDSIVMSDVFEEVQFYGFPWEKEYTSEEFIGFLSTGNAYIGLKEEEKIKLNKEIENFFEIHGNIYKMAFTSVLFTARPKRT